MATGGENRHEDRSGSDDLYGVLGLNKQCTDAELKIAYRRLAMTWHPDRCSAPGSSTRMEEAKERFQEIQGAYSVLSDSNKRFLYDFGVYDSEEDDQDLSGMGDFLGEMAEMMSQATPTDTFEELQQLFVDMFQADLDSGFCGGPHTGQKVQSPPCASRSPCPPSPASTRTPPSCKGTNKRCSPATAGSWNQPSPGCPGSGPGLDLPGSCLKGSDGRRREAPRTKDGRSGTKRQRMSTNHMQSGIPHSQQRTTVFSLSP